MSVCPLTLLSSLVETKGVQEGKEVFISPEVRQPTKELMLQLSPLRAMFSNSNTVYRIRMTKSALLTTSGGGAMALATSVIPSSFDQYTQLSALFNTVRIRKTRIQVASNLNPNNAASGTTIHVGGVFAVAFNPKPGAGSSPTTSIAEVIRLPRVLLYNPLTIVEPATNSYTFPRDTPWSTIANAGGGTDPAGGNPGYWCNVNIGNVVSVSTVYVIYHIEAEFEFKNIA